MASNGRNIREQILGLLARKDYRPLNRVDIARKLGLTAAERVALRKTLRELERAGEIARIRKNRYVLPAEADLVTGKVSIHQAGYGFLAPETPGETDVFIAAENIGTAMHGDRVVARISRDEPYRRIKGRREGRVIRILERAHDTIVGTLQRSRNFYYVVPDDPRILHDVYVGQVSNSPRDEPAVLDLPLATSKVAPQVGDKVVVRLEAWESRHVNPEGEFIVTIDPDDARDFDDAINVEKTGSGWRLGVHIADVGAYVEPNSPLDREARRRGNSVYLPDRVIPMLPERLSNGVCSLKPGVDRLTHSVFIHLDKRSVLRNARFARSVIRSAHRLTYKQAYAILTSAPRDDLGERLHVALELAAL